MRIFPNHVLRQFSLLAVVIFTANCLGADMQDGNSLSTPWRFVFKPNGRLWVWQYMKVEPDVHWDFGALIDMEIAQGRGHRIWFGGKYREAAGFRSEQEVTPFDPRHIDTYQLLTWRWMPWRRGEVFIQMQRFCFHEIDVHNPGATWMTHTAFGLGTLSPPEEGEGPLRVLVSRRPAVDAYLSMGPFIHGGPSEIMGMAPAWQWESALYSAFTYPLSRTIFLETSLYWNHLWMIQSMFQPHRNRVNIRQSIITQREYGGFSFFIDRNLHDDYPMRWNPVGWRLGLNYRF